MGRSEFANTLFVQCLSWVVLFAYPAWLLSKVFKFFKKSKLETTNPKEK